MLRRVQMSIGAVICHSCHIFDIRDTKQIAALMAERTNEVEWMIGGQVSQ